MNYKDDCLLLWAGGGGQLVSLAGFGTSDDFANFDVGFVFGGFLGSYFLGRWDVESAFLRSAIASGKCLVAFGAGAPNVFLHRMAAGGTVGESFLLSQNNFTVYPPTGSVEDGLYSPSQSAGIPPCSGLCHQSLMGDPTIRAFPSRNQNLQILDVLCSTDGGQTFRVVQTTEIDSSGTANAIFRLAIR